MKKDISTLSDKTLEKEAIYIAECLLNDPYDEHLNAHMNEFNNELAKRKKAKNLKSDLLTIILNVGLSLLILVGLLLSIRVGNPNAILLFSLMVLVRTVQYIYETR